MLFAGEGQKKFLPLPILARFLCIIVVTIKIKSHDKSRMYFKRLPNAHQKERQGYDVTLLGLRCDQPRR